MGRVIFLLEEPSMKALLDNFLPRVFPGLDFLCVPHKGKADLESSIPRKLRGWREPGVRFIILRDNDNGNCYALKERLRQLCREGRRQDALVRIVCQELEAWYLGQPDAMADAFSDENLRRLKSRARYRRPDDLAKPSQAIKRLLPEFQKTSGARRMASHLASEGSRSTSFTVFLDGIANLLPPTVAGPVERDTK